MADLHLAQTKLGSDLTSEVQSISCVVELLVKEQDKQEILTILSSITVLKRCHLLKWQQNNKKDPVLGLLYQYASADYKLKPSEIGKVKSKAAWKYQLWLLSWLDSSLAPPFHSITASLHLRKVHSMDYILLMILRPPAYPTNILLCTNPSDDSQWPRL